VETLTRYVRSRTDPTRGGGEERGWEEGEEEERNSSGGTTSGSLFLYLARSNEINHRARDVADEDAMRADF